MALQVCNHPEIFERADVVAPFSFARFGRSGPLNRDGDVLSVAYSTRNPIEFRIPQLFFTGGGLVDTPHEKANRPDGVLGKLLNIWSTDWMHHSLYETTSSCKFIFMTPLKGTTKHAYYDSLRVPSASRTISSGIT